MFFIIIYLYLTVDGTKDKLKVIEKKMKSMSNKIDSLCNLQYNLQEKLYDISDKKADKKPFDDFWSRYLSETEELSLRYFNLETAMVRYLMFFHDPPMSIEDVALVLHSSPQMVEWKIKLEKENGEWP